MSKSTFKILFYLRKNYLNKEGKAGILMSFGCPPDK